METRIYHYSTANPPPQTCDVLSEVGRAIRHHRPLARAGHIRATDTKCIKYRHRAQTALSGLRGAHTMYMVIVYLLHSQADFQRFRYLN